MRAPRGRFPSHRSVPARAAGLGAVLVAAAVVVAGCGGGKASPEEQWASDICTSVSTWKTDIHDITAQAADALTKPATARESLRTAVDDGRTATETLITELKGLTPPATPEGEQAQKDLQAFLTSLGTTADEVRATLSDLSGAGSLNEIVELVSGLSSELQATIEEGRQLVTTLEAAGGAIKDGFESAEACDALRDGS